MYLLVFVTLMIALIGTYTQVMGLQAARFASHQSAIGAAMIQWHAAAISMAVSIIKTNSAGYTAGIKSSGCMLTALAPPATGLALCPPPLFYGSTHNNQKGTITIPWNGPVYLNLISVPDTPPSTGTGTNQCVHLASTCKTEDPYSAGCTVSTTPTCGCSPGGCSTSYDIQKYQFYSILYQDGTTQQNQVVTFVTAPVISATNPAPGYISLVPFTGPAPLLGLTTSDLLRQLNNAGAPNYTIGTFDFTGAPKLKTTIGSYNLPSTGGFQNLCASSATCAAQGSVALIGSPDGF